MPIKTFHATHLTHLIILLAASLLAWSVIDGHFKRHHAQHTVARHTVTATAEEANLLIANLRRALGVYVDVNAERLARLAADPDDFELRMRVHQGIARHFGDFITFTLAESDGEVLVDDFGEHIGPLCRADLRDYADGGHFASMIHPGPSVYHFDIMLPWRHGEAGGIFFASFRPQAIAGLLQRNQTPGYRVLITRGDQDRLIEITAEGSRDQLDGHNHLAPEELARIREHGASAPIEGRTWTVMALPDERWIDAYARRLTIQLGLLAVATLLISLLTYRVERRRRAAESALRAARDELEQRVIERTAALSESEARANEIIDSAPQGMLVVDGEGRVARANGRVESLFGYSVEELIGRPVEQLLPEPMREAHEQHRRAWAEHPAARPMGNDLDLLARRKNGSLFHAEIGLAPMEVNGEPQVLATVVDVTERRVLESELAVHRSHLEELVSERTADLQAARKEAERLARVKSDFLANMSHEIRTPLNAVLGFAKIGRRDCGDDGSRRSFERILDSGEHLLRVINDILDYSKIEAGRLAVESEPFSIGETVDRALEMVEENARAKGLTLRSRLEVAPEEWVSGDPMRVGQILINLLGNAIKFTAEGAVEVTVSREGESIRFQVRDSGIGMTDEQRSRLFQPFEQADGSTSREYGGTGLGLAISERLARIMGGSLEAASAPGEGSLFTLQLPLPVVEAPRERAVAPAVEAEAETGPRLAGLRVLAAEDVETNRFILQDLLEREGAEVSFAVNGRKALERLEAAGAAAFDVVLMDVQMPVMDGYQATRGVKALAEGLPVIGLTAHALAEARERCLAAGMVDHVTKPVDGDRLVAAIRRHVASVEPALGAASAPEEKPGEEGAAVPPSDGLIDWPALWERYDRRRPFITKLIEILQRDHADTAKRLSDARQARDYPVITEIAHTLKGIVGSMEATGLQELARETEAAGHEGREEALALADRLVEGMARFLEEVSDYPRRLP